MQDPSREIMNELKNLNQSLQKLILRNNILVNLTLKELSEKQKLTTRDQIELLNSLKIDYKEMAEIFGRSQGYIASELTQLKKKKIKGGKNESGTIERIEEPKQEN